MKFEKEYIDYLIENKSNPQVNTLLELYFLDKIDFQELTENLILDIMHLSNICEI
jgi:hypothetical protein